MWQALDFSVAFTELSLRTTILVSLLAAWALVGLFQYLNRHTNRRYFSIWTAGWLFYALFLTISISTGMNSSPLLLMFRNWCIATSAVLILWGGFQFLKLPVGERTIFGVFAFVAVWSYAVSYTFPGELWIQAPAFLFLSFSHLFVACLFFNLRRRHLYLGAGLLTFGFGLWSIYLAAYPWLQSPTHLLSMGFLISSVLQLFIAVSMIVLVLEEARRDLHSARENLAHQECQAAFFRSSAEASEIRFQQIFENASDAILIVSEIDLAILEANRAAKRLLRIDPEAPFERFTRYCAFSSKNHLTPSVWLASLIQGAECSLSTADGSPVTVEVRGNSIPYNGSRAFQLLFVELTEKARLQQQLRQAEKLSALGQLISGVAHELNNPLAAIKGHTELLLLDSDLPPAGRAALNIVARESDRAAHLVRSFLAFARSDAPTFEVFPVARALEASIQLCRSELNERGISVTTDIQGAGFLCAVPNQIEQVFVNLIANARDAMAGQAPPKSIAVSSRATTDKIVIQFEDSGPGIPAELGRRIFEPFFTTKAVGAGTGLGLSLCYRIIATHDGKIELISNPRRGACFRIELPRAPSPAAEAPPDAGPNSKVVLCPKNLRILVLDDEPSLSSLVQGVLELSGHQVSAFEDATEALSQIQPGRFDLVISDFRMPVLNGGEFYSRAIHIDPSLRNRFIFLTGDVVNDETAEFFRKHPVRCLLKPFKISDIENAVASAFSGSTSTENSTPPANSDTASLPFGVF